MDNFTLELYRISDASGSLAKVSGTERVYTSDNPAGSSITPLSLGSISRKLQRKDGVYEIDNVGVSVRGLGPEYFRNYETELEQPFVFVVKESGRCIFHGYVSPDSVDYDAGTKQTSFDVFSWEKILKEHDAVARSVFETHLAADYRGYWQDQIVLYKEVESDGVVYPIYEDQTDSNGNVTREAVLKVGDVIVLPTNMGEVRARVTAKEAIGLDAGNKFIARIAPVQRPEGRVGGLSLEGVSAVRVEYSEQRPFFGDRWGYAFSLADQRLYEAVKGADTSSEWAESEGNFFAGDRYVNVRLFRTLSDANAWANGDRTVTPILGPGGEVTGHGDTYTEFEPSQGVPTIKNPEDRGEISITPGFTDASTPDGRTSFMAMSVADTNAVVSEGDTLYAVYDVWAQADAGSDVKILSEPAYGQGYSYWGYNYEAPKVIDAMFRLTEFGVLGSIYRQTTGGGASTLDVWSTLLPNYIEFPKNPLKALKLIAGTIERYIHVQPVLDGNGMPRVDVRLLPRSRKYGANELPNKAVSQFKSYSEQAANEKPRPVVVKSNEPYRAQAGETEMKGWFHEGMVAEKNSDYTLNTEAPSEDDAIIIEIAQEAGYEYSLHPSDDGDTRNYDDLSRIAKRVYEFYNGDVDSSTEIGYRREGEGTIIASDIGESYVGGKVTAAELDFDSAGGRTFFVTEEQVDLSSKTVTLKGLVGEYTPLPAGSPVAIINGPRTTTLSEGETQTDLTYDAADSYDPAGDSLSATWLLDGTQVGTGTTVTLSNLPVGLYTLELQVTNQSGYTDIQSLAVQVKPASATEAATQPSGFFVEKERIYSGGSYLGRVRYYPQTDVGQIKSVRTRKASGRELLPPTDPASTSFSDVALTTDENGVQVYEETVVLDEKHTSAISVSVEFASNAQHDSFVQTHSFQARPRAEFEAQSATVQADGDVFLSVVADNDTRETNGVEITHADSVSTITSGGGTTIQANRSDLEDGYVVPNLNLAEGETEYFRIRLYGKDDTVGESWITVVSNTYYKGQAQVTNLNFTSGASIRQTGPNASGDFHMMRDNGSGGYEYGDVVMNRAIIYDPDGNTELDAHTVTIQDNFVQVNSAADDGTTGVANAGLEINRGPDLTGQRIEWNEANTAFGSHPMGGSFVPFALNSGALQSNLNADMVDDFHFDQGVQTTDTPAFAGVVADGSRSTPINADPALYRLGGRAYLTVYNILRLRQSGAADESFAFEFNTSNGRLSLGGQAFGTSHAVRADRTISGTGTLGFDVQDGGNLTDDLTLKVVPPQDLQETGAPTFAGATMTGHLNINATIGSPSYTSGIFGSGWRVDTTATGGAFAEFDNMRIRNELRTHIFRKDIVRATNGYLMITDVGEQVVNNGVAGSYDVITIKDPVFEDGDQIWYKNADNSGNITGIRAAVVPHDSPDTGQVFATVTVGGRTAYEYKIRISNGASGTTYAGDTWVRYSGGFILNDASSQYSPFIGVYGEGVNNGDFSTGPNGSEQINPAKELARFGRMDGLTRHGTNLTGFGLFGERVFLTGSVLVGDFSKTGSYFEFTNTGGLDIQYVGQGGNTRTLVGITALADDNASTLTQSVQYDNSGAYTRLLAGPNGSEFKVVADNLNINVDYFTANSIATHLNAADTITLDSPSITLGSSGNTSQVTIYGNGTFSGKITAESGEIGGLTIENSYLETNDGVTRAVLAQDASGFNAAYHTSQPTLSMYKYASTQMITMGDIYRSGGAFGIAFFTERTNNVRAFELSTRELQIASIEFDTTGMWTTTDSSAGSFAGMQNASQSLAFFSGADDKRGTNATYGVAYDGSGFAGNGFEWDAAGNAQLNSLDIAGTLTMGAGGIIDGTNYQLQDGQISVANGAATLGADGLVFVAGQNASNKIAWSDGSQIHSYNNTLQFETQGVPYLRMDNAIRMGTPGAIEPLVLILSFLPANPPSGSSQVWKDQDGYLRIT